MDPRFEHRQSGGQCLQQGQVLQGRSSRSVCVCVCLSVCVSVCVSVYLICRLAVLSVLEPSLVERGRRGGGGEGGGEGRKEGRDS